MLQIDQASTFEALATKEWLVTNGIGGYASSSILGTNTRRYHGLLVAAQNPPTERTVLVSKIEECILFSRDCAFALSANQYPGVVHPNGQQYLKFFERRPFPCMKFEAHGYHLLKTVFMVQGSNTTIVAYENTGDSTFKLRLSPLFVFRDYHALYKENAAHDYWMQPKNGYTQVHATFGSPPLFMKFTAGEWTEKRDWFRNFQYAKEAERGLDDMEDAYMAGHVEVLLKPGEKTFLVFSTDEAMMKPDPEVLKNAEILRLGNIVSAAPNDPFIKDLMLAANQFVVRRKHTNSYTIIAGYHWFTDWGRDTMIAMRGLTIATGEQAVSKSIIETFLHYLDQGMLPNRFPDQQEALEYNTIDATLWLFVVLYEYYQKFDDLAFVEQVFEQLTDIMEHHVAGTRYGIKVTPEGFLQGGEGLAQLTWMDAKIGDHVVTPRHGCPVEIQALWYNALRIYQYFAGKLSHPFEQHLGLADLLKGNFKKYFLRKDGSLNDVIRLENGTWVSDASMRPNQIYILSLPFALLSQEDEKKVLKHVTEDLLTPYGLRTLATDHLDFKPKFEGDPWHRDTAYHQGTVWPFLLGEYCTAYLKVNGWSDKSYKAVQKMIDPLKQHFYQDGCIQGISEVFDGQLPMTGKGTANQAWSVAAILKILLEIKAHESKPKSKNILPFLFTSSLIF